MKTLHKSRPPEIFMTTRLLLAGMFAAAVVLAQTARAQDAEKSYTLFKGADISVGQGSDLRPVRDVAGGAWIVSVNGQPVSVSASRGPINMKITPILKLTDNSAVVSNLQGKRAYTFANDPSVKMTRALNDAAIAQAGYQAAANQAIAFSSQTILATEMGLNRTSASGTTSPATTSSSIQQALNTAQQNQTVADNNAGGDLSILGSPGDSGDCDALDVSFEVSAERPLAEPYLVMITRFHERGGADGTFRNLVYAKALNPIGARATRVEFEQAGFPPGYELQNFEIHLYNRGEEIATNVAPRREVLSGEKAFEYVKSTYLAAHKGATLPAVPALVGKLPADLPERLASGKYGDPFYVMVSKDGLAGEAFLDAACSKRIDDPYLESIVRDIRFKPALAQGAPVEGVVSLNLSKLRI